LSGGHHEFGAYHSGIKRYDGDVVRPKFVRGIGGEFVGGGLRESIERVAKVLLRMA
jgi:hypothetical protein